MKNNSRIIQINHKRVVKMVNLTAFPFLSKKDKKTASRIGCIAFSEPKWYLNTPEIITINNYRNIIFIKYFISINLLIDSKEVN
jgi:hypothetical protein